MFRSNPTKALAFAAGAVLLLTLAACGDGSRGTALPLSDRGPVADLANALGFSDDEAADLIERQSTLESKNREVVAELSGEWSAGTWIDARTGVLRVAVTNESRAEQMRAKGLSPRVVSRTGDDLDRIRGEVGDLISRHGVRGVSWYTDVAKNTVVVSARSVDLTGSFRADLDALGDAVEVRVVKSAPAVHAAPLLNGDEITSEGRLCSAGWWVAKDNKNLLLTAGHCVRDRLTWSHNGQVIGNRVDHRFDTSDWGIVEVSPDAPSQLTDRFSLFLDGSLLKIDNINRSPVGSVVCKRGRTTGHTCGEVLTHDTDIVLSDGQTLRGMSQAQIAAEGGDSGGPVYSINGARPDSVFAEGIVSGGNAELMFYTPMATVIQESNALLVVSAD